MEREAPPLNRLRICLAALSPHVDPDRVALTGGVAIALSLPEGRWPRAGAPIADLDLVADSRDAVRNTVAAAFLVSHYHVPQPGYAKFMIQLVEPGSRLRVDIFPADPGSLERARPVTLDGRRWLVLDLESILAHKLRTLAGASAAAPVPRKHFEDARALARHAGREIPAVPPAHLSREVFSQDLDMRCARCEASSDPGFPLAPKRRIHDLLGYV